MSLPKNAESVEYETWIKKIITSFKPEPFCPFDICYCDYAYSDKCIDCINAKVEFVRQKLS